MSATLDDQIGHDANAEARLATLLADRARALKPEPARLDAFMAGLAHQGLLTRPAIASALQPFMTLPKPEPRTRTRARMAQVIAERVAGFGHITRDDLEAAGFSGPDIASLFRAALRASGVERMVA